MEPRYIATKSSWSIFPWNGGRGFHIIKDLVGRSPISGIGWNSMAAATDAFWKSARKSFKAISNEANNWNCAHRQSIEWFHRHKKYSSFNKLVGIMATVHVATQLIRKHKRSKFITASDLSRAKTGIIRCHQKKYYTKELNLLQNDMPLPKDSKI